MNCMSRKCLKLIVLTAGMFSLAWSGLAKSATVIFQNRVAKTATPNAAQAVPTRQYSHGEPSNDEQYLLELVDRARANPYNEANLICNSPDRHIQQGLVIYNIDTDQLIRDFAAYDRKPPLAFNTALLASARVHSQDMAAHDFQGHVSSDGSTLADRMQKAGYSYRIGGENVFSYAHSAFYAQAAFLVDWGVDDLGHRKNLLDLDAPHTGFREIGISIVPEDDSRTAVGPLVITQDFGTSDYNTVFITGVIYRDADNNNFYDPGEGLAGVTVMPNHGEYYAVTSASGGFAIPVAVNSGEYVLKASRADLPEMSTTVVVTEENLKVDFPLGSPAYATVEGTVVSSATSQAVSGVKIMINSVGRVYTTDAEGYFIFSDLPAGSYRMTAELEGYTFTPNDFSVTLTAGQSTRLRLNANPISSSTITPEPTPPSDTIIDGAGGMCGSAGISLIAMFMLAFGTLTERRR